VGIRCVMLKNISMNYIGEIMSKVGKVYPVTSMGDGVFSSDSSVTADLGGEKSGQFSYKHVYVRGRREQLLYRSLNEGSVTISRDVFEELGRPSMLNARIKAGKIQLKNAAPQCQVTPDAE